MGGLFDAISGIFRSGVDFVTDFGGGAFAAVDERLRGGQLRTTGRASAGRRAGVSVANLFGDIGERYIEANTPVFTIGGQLERQRTGGGFVQDPRELARLEAQAFPGRAVPRSELIPGLEAFAGEVSAGQVQQAALLPAVAGGALVRALPFLSGVTQNIIGGAVSEGLDVLRERIFGGGEMPGQRALALPGGKSIMQPALPAAGRVFNIHQNLNTGAVTARARTLLMMMNPLTGSPTFYRHVGTPLIFSRDPGICRMVERTARKLSKGRRRPR